MHTKEPATQTPADGRHARAERTREAIVEALLALLGEGVLRPSGEQIAERAGVSRRAIWNHFTDLDDLLACAARRRMETVMPLWPKLPRDGTAAERARAVAEGVGRFHEHVAPVRRAAVLFAHDLAFLAGQLREAARMHRAAIRAVFEAEIEAAPEETRAVLLAGLAAAASFSMWEELRRNQELSVDEATCAVRIELEGMLERAARN
ncbi:TetR/AcrR family transcriptional regulator [Polyangium jinanense]|uniref:TetR/AcrR family transcriptional regulator n=1 Tax=Polyangium jinanense TaxID=2829994 RepID=A0A9X3WZQ0_9BACT|nr:TetR/AcrR family transcriptional regulator [Polyangium jinanense]MDC3954891.1 TetR/AcrR family transcriptional regulator [Polyangium jinanense]MDC3981339.1 TetR/AcrR family transcriptional regulator [Polyangium jinanense]